MFDLRNRTFGGPYHCSKATLATFAALVILTLPFFLRPYVVSGISMQPTFEEGELLLVENISPRLIGLPRGSVVVFRDPRHPKHPIIVKRVVGLPNETVRITDDVLTIVQSDGTEEILERGSLTGREHNGADMTTKLGPEDYFLMGDNRSQSEDSRHWGTIQPHEMIGRPVLRLRPIDRFRLFPG